MFSFMNLFKRRPPEVADLLEKINSIEKSIPSECAGIGGELLSVLKKTVKRKWETKHDKNYADQIKEGETHEAFIYNFIIHSCADQLGSGQHHIYRGVLGARGIQHRQLFEHSINTMVSIGGYTKVWADENLRRPVYKEVQEVG